MSRPPINNVRGALWMLAGSMSLAATALSVKFLGGDLPSPVIVFCRSIFGILFILPFLARHGLRIFATKRPQLHVLRAFAAVGNIAGYPDAAKLFGQAGGGFRDLTRIAGSSPEMWRDICLANRDAILQGLDGYLSDLEAMRGLLDASDGPALEAVFAGARAARAKWLVPR